MLPLLRVYCSIYGTHLSVLWALQNIYKWYVGTKNIFQLLCFPIIDFFGLTFLCTPTSRDVRVSTLVWHLPQRSRCFESGETLHKCNEEHVHRQTKCHQSDHLPGFRSKTETSRNLAHICFLWRTKVMKSLTREASRDGGREREKQESRWFQLESYR